MGKAKLVSDTETSNMCLKLLKTDEKTVSVLNGIHVFTNECLGAGFSAERQTFLRAWGINNESMVEGICLEKGLNVIFNKIAIQVNPLRCTNTLPDLSALRHFSS